MGVLTMSGFITALGSEAQMLKCFLGYIGKEGEKNE